MGNTQVYIQQKARKKSATLTNFGSEVKSSHSVESKKMPMRRKYNHSSLCFAYKQYLILINAKIIVETVLKNEKKKAISFLYHNKTLLDVIQH